MTEPSARRWRPGFGQAWVAVVAIAEVISVLLEIGTPLQPLLSIVFVVTVPGLAILDLDKPTDFAARLMLGITGSIGLNVALVTLGLSPSFVWILAVGIFTFWGIQRYWEARRLRSESPTPEHV